MKPGRIVKHHIKGLDEEVNFYTVAEDPKSIITHNSPRTCVEVEQSNHTCGVNGIVRDFIKWPKYKPFPMNLQWAHSRDPRAWSIPFDGLFDDFWLWGDREYTAHTFYEEPWKEKQEAWSSFPVRSPEQKFWKLGSPYLYLPKITLPRKGTLFVPKGDNLTMNRLGLLESLKALKKLPAKFKPITVCLRLNTLRQGSKQHQIVEAAGMDWVTLGWPNYASHASSLQHLFNSHEYVTTDYPGSPRHLALYWGCKFFYLHRDIPGYGKRPIQAYYGGLLGKPFDKGDNLIFKPQTFHHYILDEFPDFCLDAVEESHNSDKAKWVIDNDMGLQYKKSRKELGDILTKLTEKEIYQYYLEVIERYEVGKKRTNTERDYLMRNNLFKSLKSQLLAEQWKWLRNNHFLLMKDDNDYSPEWKRTLMLLTKICFRYLSYKYSSNNKVEYNPPAWVYNEI